jgi:hypothetical protein
LIFFREEFFGNWFLIYGLFNGFFKLFDGKSRLDFRRELALSMPQFLATNPSLYTLSIYHNSTLSPKKFPKKEK